jgi:hypothetical protein
VRNTEIVCSIPLLLMSFTQCIMTMLRSIDVVLLGYYLLFGKKNCGLLGSFELSHWLHEFFLGIKLFVIILGLV